MNDAYRRRHWTRRLDRDGPRERLSVDVSLIQKCSPACRKEGAECVDRRSGADPCDVSHDRFKPMHLLERKKTIARRPERYEGMPTADDAQTFIGRKAKHAGADAVCVLGTLQDCIRTPNRAGPVLPSGHQPQPRAATGHSSITFPPRAA